MPAFRYQQGDRPLDGYTIEYGLGRGGFGEVYFAVSDSGRHVALKAVQNYEEIELRGIRHCMNLKSPHLVTIFDVKFNDRGEPFVIMEYVSGPSLRGLLDEAPQGMGETKSAFFLQEIAKGLTYLHDQGIVHRDLKPHNVFYEEGFVKIGDYSLSKALSTSHRSGHTMTVGTVHYMAPEISMGRYDERVDIYALGIILYEMLRGQPPYSGQTMGEILMKHIAGEPDLRGMEEPFASAIRRALAKNPDDRFASAAEMAAAVFGARHIHDSVAEFNPQHLSLVAARIGAKVQAATAATLPPTDTPSPVAPAPRTEPPVRSPATAELGLAYHTGRSLGLLAKHTGLVSLRRTYEADARQDTLDPRQRIGLAVLCVLAMSIGCGLLGSQLGAWSGQGVSAWQVGIWALGAMVGGAASLMLASRWFGSALASESALVRRLVLAAASWLGAWGGLVVVAPISDVIGSAFPRSDHLHALMWASFLPLLLVDLRQLAATVRRQRITLGPALFTGLLACTAAFPLGAPPVLALGVTAGIVLAVQVASPFVPRSSQRGASPFAASPFAVNRLVGERPVAPAQAEAAPPTPAPPTPLLDAASNKISSRSRTIALILGIGPAMAGICGLQRLYVGKVWTGLLYLMTAGLFGIGQVIDVILIAGGQFKDDRDRRLELWEGSSTTDGRSAAVPVNSWSSVPVGPGWGAVLANFLGTVLLLAACLVGLSVAMRIPEAIAAWERAELIHSNFAQTMQGLLGTPDWPQIVSRLAMLASLSLYLSGASVLLLARRHGGVWHMMRALWGSMCYLATVGLLALVFDRPDWTSIARLVASGQIGVALEGIVGRDESLMACVFAGIMFLVGAVLLGWPPPSRPLNSPAPQVEGELKEAVR